MDCADPQSDEHAAEYTLYEWFGSMDPSRYLRVDMWEKMDRPTEGYSAQKPTYEFRPDFSPANVETYGSVAAMLNHALEITYGCRGSPNWSIWAMGDRLNTAAWEVEKAITHAKLDESDPSLFLLDLWVLDLKAKMRAM
jgi:hypothetical protein